MKIFKKAFFSLGALAAITTPIAVIACGTIDSGDKLQQDEDLASENARYLVTVDYLKFTNNKIWGSEANASVQRLALFKLWAEQQLQLNPWYFEILVNNLIDKGVLKPAIPGQWVPTPGQNWTNNPAQVQKAYERLTSSKETKVDELIENQVLTKALFTKATKETVKSYTGKDSYKDYYASDIERYISFDNPNYFLVKYLAENHPMFVASVSTNNSAQYIQHSNDPDKAIDQVDFNAAATVLYPATAENSRTKDWNVLGTNPNLFGYRGILYTIKGVAEKEQFDFSLEGLKKRQTIDFKRGFVDAGKSLISDKSKWTIKNKTVSANWAEQVIPYFIYTTDLNNEYIKLQNTGFGITIKETSTSTEIGSWYSSTDVASASDSKKYDFLKKAINTTLSETEALAKYSLTSTPANDKSFITKTSKDNIPHFYSEATSTIFTNTYIEKFVSDGLALGGINNLTNDEKLRIEEYINTVVDIKDNAKKDAIIALMKNVFKFTGTVPTTSLKYGEFNIIIDDEAVNKMVQFLTEASKSIAVQWANKQGFTVKSYNSVLTKNLAGTGILK